MERVPQEKHMKNNNQLPQDRSSTIKKVTILSCLVLATALLWIQFGELLSLDYLANQEATLRDYQRSQPVFVLGIAYTIYVLVTGLSLPGAAVLTLAYGWYFGTVRGLVLVSFASTTGATLAFLLSRYFFREAVRSRFGDRLESLNQALERDGPFYLFTLRLITRRAILCDKRNDGVNSTAHVYVLVGESVGHVGRHFCLRLCRCQRSEFANFGRPGDKCRLCSSPNVSDSCCLWVARIVPICRSFDRAS